MTKKKTEDIWGKNCFICICLQITEQIIWQINVDANSVRKKNTNNNNMKSQLVYKITPSNGKMVNPLRKSRYEKTI